MNKIFANLHMVILLCFAMLIVSNYMTQQEALEAAQSEFSGVQSQYEKKKKDVAAINDYYKDINRAKENIEAAASQIEKLQRQLPNEVSNTENLEIFQGIANTLNIKNISLIPGEETDKGFYIAKEYNFKANGTFLQFLIFFERLSKVERLFNIKYVRLNIGSHRQRGSRV